MPKFIISIRLCYCLTDLTFLQGDKHKASDRQIFSRQNARGNLIQLLIHVSTCMIEVELELSISKDIQLIYIWCNFTNFNIAKYVCYSVEK